MVLTLVAPLLRFTSRIRMVKARTKATNSVVSMMAVRSSCGEACGAEVAAAAGAGSATSVVLP